jgi:hypothetical protein
MNRWIEHVKRYQEEYGVSYAVALREAKATYRKN